MPAYVVALIESIHDPETYKAYVSQVAPTLAAFGGRFLARAPGPEPLEGGPAPSRAVVLEFPSVDHARRWHASPEYQPVLKLRQGASRGTLLLLPAYGDAGRVAVHDVCYVEHVSRDPDATRALLEGVHGWRFDAPDPDLGGSRVATLPNGARASVRPPLRPDEAPVTRTYVRVADVEASTSRAEQAGADVAVSAMPLGAHGRISIVILGGVEHGLWELPGPTPPAP